MTFQDMSAQIRVNNLFTSLNFHTIFNFLDVLLNLILCIKI